MTAPKKVKVQSRALKMGLRHTAYYLAPDGSYRGVGTYPDKREARSKAWEGYKESRKSEWIDPKGSKTLLDTYMRDRWLPSLLVENHTKMSYESTYRIHIQPTFGAREMGSILYTEVQTWLNELETRKVGRANQRTAYVILNTIFRAAQRDRLISARPTDGIRTRPIPQREVLIFLPHHWDKFYEQVPDYWKPLMTVAVETGMRPSELRALSPQQIDWTRQRIRIDRATIVNSFKSGYGRFVEKAYPKGKRPRTISVDRPVLTALAALMNARGLDPDSDERIFLSDRGRPIAEEVNDVMTAACEAAGVPRRTFKHLRSTKASWMLRDTRDLMGVKEHLGHADIATTQKYLAVVADDEPDMPTLTYRDYLAEGPLASDQDDRRATDTSVRTSFG